MPRQPPASRVQAPLPPKVPELSHPRRRPIPSLPKRPASTRAGTSNDRCGRMPRRWATATPRRPSRPTCAPGRLRCALPTASTACRLPADGPARRGRRASSADVPDAPAPGARASPCVLGAAAGVAPLVARTGRYSSSRAWPRGRSLLPGADVVVPPPVAGAVGTAAAVASPPGGAGLQAPVAAAVSPAAALAAQRAEREAKVQELMGAGNWNVLVLHAAEWTRKDPTYADAWKYLAVGYANMRQHDDAFLAGEKATQLAPADRELWRNLGRLGSPRADRKARCTPTNRRSRSTGRMPRASCRSGRLQAELGLLPQAKATFDRALTASPGDPDALCGQAQVAQRQGRGKDAEAIVRDLRRGAKECSLAEAVPATVARPHRRADRSRCRSAGAERTAARPSPRAAAGRPSTGIRGRRSEQCRRQQSRDAEPERGQRVAGDEAAADQRRRCSCRPAARLGGAGCPALRAAC